jgi:hypothetical protein
MIKLIAVNYKLKNAYIHLSHNLRFKVKCDLYWNVNNRVGRLLDIIWLSVSKPITKKNSLKSR